MKPISLLTILFMMVINLPAQEKKPITRIASITIDSVRLEAYRSLLKEQMEMAIRLEPGVISYTVYANKINPAKLTIIEVYASNEAYLAHRETTHFKKYKTAVADMVKTLELSEVDLVFDSKKRKN